MKIPSSAALPLLTERLLIREFVDTDAFRMRDFALDPDFWRHTSLDIVSVEALDIFTSDVIAEQKRTPRPFYNLAVNTRDTGTLVGFVKTGLVSSDDGVGMLGYAIGGQYAGMGYATEAAAALLPFVFVALGFHRLTANCDANNPASARVLEKLGFILEGRLRENRLVDGVRTDSLVYGLLADDFLVAGL